MKVLDIPVSSAREQLTEQYRQVRAFTHKLCETLEKEDYVVQTIPDVSPAKWHLAHTSWFFETFLLKGFVPGFKPFFPMHEYLFNSYYNAVGEQFPRPARGLLSRPTVDEVYEYRALVDQHVTELLQIISEQELQEVAPIVTLGINHEQQHQELLLTDIKHVLSVNPLNPVFRDRPEEPRRSPGDMRWVGFPEGIHEIGHPGGSFSFDNEGPRHRVLLNPFQMASRLVTNGEYMRFIADGGYQESRFWLSDGWMTVQAEAWEAPLYWRRKDGEWWNFTLSGFRPVDPDEPVCHVSLYEAEAYAAWAGCRLPTEAEWEVAAADVPVEGNFVESGRLHPAPAPEPGEAGFSQMFGDVWEWTGSAYLPYPGYHPPEGAIGEYNGKFMCNQWTLRGGSCATSVSHIRPTYRNFFRPFHRWQFMGIRLAKEG